MFYGQVAEWKRLVKNTSFHPNPALSGLARLAALGCASRSRCCWVAGVTMKVCIELLSKDLQRYPSKANSRIANMDFGLLQQRHDIRRLIFEWFVSSKKQRSPFDAFRDLWQSFNEWAKLVTRQRIDRHWVDALMLNTKAQQMFALLVSDDEEFLFTARNFQRWWPIFDAETINERGLRWQFGNRDEARSYYFGHNIPFSPPCWKRHSVIPLDWPHTLSALYQVRNNLVHGAKSRSRVNSELVKDAYGVLFVFLDKGKWLLE